MKNAVTVVVLTHNSAKTLNRCLKSLSWCANIIIVDDYSTDSTLDIANRFRVTIYRRHLSGDWSSQRNYAFSKSPTNWVLFIDSDEYVTPQLRHQITTTLNHDNKYHGYYLHRKDKFLGQVLYFGETANVKLLRLADKRFGKWCRSVHEAWRIKPPIGDFSSPIIHERQLTISQFIDRLNTYSSLESQPFHWIDLFKPKLKFIKNYFYLFGFLDRTVGFIFSYLMSFNSLIVRVKSWEKRHT